jgi:hypothetical protein
MARLAVDRIRTDGATQPRAAIHEPTVAEYAEAIEAGVVLPPVTVFNDGGTYWLADGFHRVAATKRIGCLDIEVDLRVGTRRDAMLHSFGANATHGLRRTNDDKRRAVVAMLSDPDWAAWSSREIARVCAVDHKTVAKVRTEMAPHLGISPDRSDDGEPGAGPSEDSKTRRTVQRGDTEYEMNVAPINAARPKAPPADPDETLERDLALAEAELGDAEVRQLREQLAEAHETIQELTIDSRRSRVAWTAIWSPRSRSSRSTSRRWSGVATTRSWRTTSSRPRSSGCSGSRPQPPPSIAAASPRRTRPAAPPARVTCDAPDRRARQPAPDRLALAPTGYARRG